MPTLRPIKRHIGLFLAYSDSETEYPERNLLFILFPFDVFIFARSLYFIVKILELNFKKYLVQVKDE